jgi:YihY family inner membrane protein
VSDESWIDRPRVVRVRRRSVVVDRAARTAEAYSRHRTGRNAALTAYYGFLSVFPMVLVLTTILGFVLQRWPTLQERIIDSTMGNIPIIGPTIGTDPSALRGNTGVLVIGLVLALWSSMRAFVALQTGLDDVYELGPRQRANFALHRLQALGGIAVIGLAQVLSAGINAVAALVSVSWMNQVLLLLGSMAINTAVLVYTYRYICSATPPWGEVLPGAFVGGLAFSLLQLVGTQVVARAIANASPIYGTFASVIALTWWLGLHSTIALGGAEMNRVLATP